MNKQRNIISVGIIIALILAITFWHGGSSPNVFEYTGNTQINEFSEKDPDKNKEIQPEQKINNIKEIEKNQKEIEKENIDNIPVNFAEESSNEEVVSEINSATTEQHTPEPENNHLSCTLSVRCDNIIKNIARLSKEKVDIVPENGVVFAEKSVVFYEGESVFNLLVREMKQNKIHLEFERTPVENGAYIEGIANLYEFDCGELSGWMYKVNGNFPNYGCSQYKLKSGDKVEWVYTCDLGRDVGKYYASENN